MHKQLTFIIERETPGAVRFTETDASGKINKQPADYTVGTLYIRKHAFDGAVPSKLRVTIEEA